MKRFVILLATLVFFFSGCDPAANRSAGFVEAEDASMAAPVTAARTPCSETSSLLLARAVLLAAPIVIDQTDVYLNEGTRLRAFVTEYRPYFGRDGEAIRCAALVGPRITAQGTASYDPTAYERVISSAPPEVGYMANDIADRMNQGSVAMFELGQELTWLAGVLPAVAEGDREPFHTTGYPIRDDNRRAIAQAWPLMQMMCQTSGCPELAAVMPELSRTIDEVALGTNYVLIMLAR
jgi:hypothetical protein